MANPRLPDFPGLVDQNHAAHKAALLLETAAHSLRTYLDEENCAAQAQRLRGAAILASTAAIELGVCAGWHEAACSAVDSGLVGGPASGAGTVPPPTELDP